MKSTHSSLLLAALLAMPAGLQAGTVLYTDNFNIPDTISLDGSDQTGRHTGVLASSVVLRSGGVQQTISGGQLNILTPPFGRVRLQDAAVLPTNTLWNFASGPAGAAILADGGFRVEFDWTPPNNTTTDWISFNLGYNYFDTAVGVNTASTDFGILFRNNGNTLIFDNGANPVGSAGTFSAATLMPHHATLDFTFNSFADGTTVTANVYVDNVLVAAPLTFDWNGNAGVINMELGANDNVKILDNFSISTVPEPSGVVLLALGGLTALGRRRRQA